MTAFVNPALKKFAEHIGEELVFAQVLIQRSPQGHELRHVEDRGAPASELRLVTAAELRTLSQITATGAFRPLKSAPNLKTRWRAVIANDAELEHAMNALYPGAVADWFAAQAGPPPVTNFREYTGRQTGMYRLTTILNDLQAGAVIQACCRGQFCLKRRLWTVAGLETDSAKDKSLIPCLEPCAVLLEFARKAMRIEQEEKRRVEFALEELTTLQTALASALAQPGGGREADFNSPDNPRRAQLLLLKLQSALDALTAKGNSPEK